jgi:cytoskeletal protein RodZ
MSSFKRKKIEKTPRVCLRLKEAREQAGLSIEQMSQKTRLGKKYIIALERCEFDQLPKGSVYQKNFIKRYLDVLNISSTSYTQQFLIEEGYEKKEEENQQIHPHTAKPLSRFHALPDLMKYISIAIIFFAVLGYLGWQVNRILEPPMLTLVSPTDGYITSDERVVIRGTSEPETSITINGKEVSIGGEGRFEQELDLVEGVNTIVVSATKKHGKTTTETRYVTQRPVQRISSDPIKSSRGRSALGGEVNS